MFFHNLSFQSIEINKPKKGFLSKNKEIKGEINIR